MGPDIATRIRARFSRRRSSATPSLVSSRSETDSSTPPRSSQHREPSSSLQVPSQTGLVHSASDITDYESHGRESRSDKNVDSQTRSWVVTKASSGGDDDLPSPQPQPQPQPATAADRPLTTETAPGERPEHSTTCATDAEAGAVDACRTTETVAVASHGQSSQQEFLRDPAGAGDWLGQDLRPKPSHSPLLQPSNLQSIHEDSASTPTSTTNTDHDHDHENQAGIDPDHLSLDFAHTPATTAPDTTADTGPVTFEDKSNPDGLHPHDSFVGPPTPASTASFRPSAPVRRQSLISNRHSALIKTLLYTPQPTDSADTHAQIDAPDHDHDHDAAGRGAAVPLLPLPLSRPLGASMATRKIWVRRPGASATLVTINEEDLVDDVRDMILRKYANSLGRNFDAPDLSIRIRPRDHQKDRPLGPDEPMGRTLEAYFPGGQAVNEALVIDIPRRTPKPSPRLPLPHTAAAAYYADDGRPSEAGEGYFPPVGGGPSSPHLPFTTAPAAANGTLAHSISVLGTGHIPPIPSPGGSKTRPHGGRPRLGGRTNTASPTIVANGPSGAGNSTASVNHGVSHFLPRKPHSRSHSEASDPQTALHSIVIPPSTSPGAETSQLHVSTPPPPVGSPRVASGRSKKIKKHIDQPTSQAGMLNGTVPPISVLIVEDNPINLRLLEAFVKRLKVRWKTAMNGRDAVKKWRTGGFHLVLMDIQLPIMNGLDATREIRRLERINSIGVFSSTPNTPLEETNGQLQLNEEDRLGSPSMFKSPVIIVALTASSLQSDRHEALAAGCNDFLTKPVNFVWLERKVMEWGCMQALIDFDGWRKWKDFSNEAEHNEAAKKAPSNKAKPRKNRSSLSST